MSNRLVESLVRAADVVERHDRLCHELAELGRREAARCYRYGEDYAVSLWDSVPEGTEIGGELWAAIEAGFRHEWRRRSLELAVLDCKREAAREREREEAGYEPPTGG